MNKRRKSLYLIVILVCLSVFCTIHMNVFAEQEWLEQTDSFGGTIYYTIENNEAVFCHYKRNDMSKISYKIPEKIQGYPVTVIATGAFSDAGFLDITIPDTVKTIEEDAFGIHSLSFTEFVVPDSVTTLGWQDFRHSAVERVVLGDGLKSIEATMFLNAENLKSVSLGSGLKKIGARAFEDCVALEHIELPVGLETIGERAFLYCMSLKGITIPDTVSSLGEAAFSSCDSLEYAHIGSGLTSLANGLFLGDGRLSNVTLGKNLEQIDDNAFGDCSALQTITFPNKLEHIGSYAFSGTGLTSVSLPRSVRTIGKGAFKFCVGLGQVRLNYGLREIGAYAFSEATALCEITIPDSVIRMDPYAFSQTSIARVQIGSGLEGIESGCFEQTAISDIYIPDTITYIDSDAFARYNAPIESIYIGDGVERIGPRAFYGMDENTSVRFNKNIRYLANAGFEKVKTIELYDGLEVLDGTFYCSAIEEITIPDSVTEMWGCVFADCDALTEVAIPDKVTYIDDEMFARCDSLDTVVLGRSVERIEDEAFVGCKSLRRIYMPVSVTYIARNAFGYELNQNRPTIIYAGTEEQWCEIKNAFWIQSYADVSFLGIGSAYVNVPTPSEKEGKKFYSKTKVYKNLNDMSDPTDNYVVCPQALIRFEGNEYTADANGVVPLPEGGEIIVSAPGYRTETMGYTDYMNGLGIFLEKETDLPIIKSVKLGKLEARRDALRFFKSKTDFFYAEVDPNGNAVERIYIENGSNIWEIWDSGNSSEIDVGKLYKTYSRSRIVVEMADGRSIYKWLDMGFAPEVDTKPTISFGDSFSKIGQDTIPYMNELNFNFALPNVPFTVTVDGDKVLATCGVSLAKWEYNGKTSDGDSRHDVNQSVYNVLKDSYAKMEGSSSPNQEYEELLKELGDSKTKGMKGKFGFDADVSVLGFLEGTITDDGIDFTESGIMVAVTAEGGYSGGGVVIVGTVPVPYNWEAKLKTGLEAKLSLVQKDESGEEMVPRGTLSATVGFEADLGPGVSAAHVNFGSAGHITPTLIFEQDSTSFKLDAKVGVYIEAVLGPFEFKDYVAERDFPLYPTLRMKKMSVDMLSAQNYLPVERTQTATTNFTANTGSETSMYGTVAETVIKTHTFKVCNPQLVDLGAGKRLLVWIDEDYQTNALNGRTLMYSYYDGSLWSDEKYVDRNGMGAYNPQLKVVAGRAYLAWESVKCVLSENATLSDMLENTEIKYAVFDEATQTFMNMAKLTDNTYADTNPVISELGNTAIISWIENKTSELLSANSHNALCYAVVNETGIVDIQTVAENLNYVDSHVATGSSEDIELLYTVDTDMDLSTTADNELFSTRMGQLTADSVQQSGLQNVKQQIYFYQDGRLMQYLHGNMWDAGVGLADDQFVICENAVLTTRRDGVGSEIYADFRQNGQAVKLTQTDGYCLEDISVFENEQGEFVLVAGKRHIIGDFGENIATLYGRTDLTSMVISPSFDLTVDYVYTDVNMLLPGFDTIIEADVTNSGSKIIEQVHIALYDSENHTLLAESEEWLTIMPGESTTLQFIYTLPETFVGMNAYLIVTAPNERSTHDNCYDLSLRCVDLSVDALNYAERESGEPILYANISNSSLVAQSDITVQLSCEGEIIEEKTIPSLDAFEGTVVTFETVEKGNRYSVAVLPKENETMLGNNDDFILLPDLKTDKSYPYHIDGISLSPNEDGTLFNITASITANEPTKQSAILFVSFYNRANKLVIVKPIPVDFTGESIKNVTDTIEITEYSEVRAMLWDTAMCPLAPVLE